MGWKRNKYDKRRREGFASHFNRRSHINTPAITDGRDLISGRFVFRPHFFNGYRDRVLNDPLRTERTDEDIMRIVAHSMSDADIPQRLSPERDFKLLVNMHIHEGNQEIPYGFFYIPIKRDRYDIMSGRICAVTLLDYEERFDRLLERGVLSSLQ